MKKSAKKDKSQAYYTSVNVNEALGNVNEAFSDSEAVPDSRGGRRPMGYYQLASSLPDMKAQHLLGSMNQPQTDGNFTDEGEGDDAYLDFGHAYGNKNVRTGRQRKKIAARSKGGEFQTRRRKRRVYFCCISSEIDIQKLLDYLNSANDLLYDWKLELYNDVLHLYKPGTTDDINAIPKQRYSLTTDDTYNLSPSPLQSLKTNKTEPTQHSHLSLMPSNKQDFLAVEDSTRTGVDSTISFDEYLKNKLNKIDQPDNQQALEEMKSHNTKLLSYASKEVFVFDFGAAVFWGFSRGEEVGLLKTIRMFVTKGMVGVNEFEYGEDDMAFVISPEQKAISLANDVITLPDDTLPKQRMAISFAIAQSSVLGIFEARIEQKIEEYKYIPEALAAYGKLDISERQLGMMIGEVFVIRHDVNLHTEILGENRNCFFFL
jgi:uncharacterized Rmd1/YagE family protein